MAFYSDVLNALIYLLVACVWVWFFHPDSVTVYFPYFCKCSYSVDVEV